MQPNDSWIQMIVELFRKMIASPYGLWIVGIVSALVAFLCWSLIRDSDSSESVTNSSNNAQN